MNALNQIILEGEVTSLIKNRKNEFIIEYLRNYPKTSDKLFATEHFHVVMPKTMADNVSKHLEVGRGVRIVGNLGKRNNGVIINLEHIEFKPNFKNTVDPK